MSTEAKRLRQRGISMLELVLFIVVVGLGAAGILSVLNFTVSKSSDPLPVKQALAIAESLMEEVQLSAFTWCDPDDPDVLTATGPGDCTVLVEGMGPEAGDTRPFDNVNDYHNFSMTGITDLTGAGIPGLAAYNADVIVAAAALSGAPALLITVTVTGPGATSVSLSGYRTRYAPNSIP